MNFTLYAVLRSDTGRHFPLLLLVVYNLRLVVYKSGKLGLFSMIRRMMVWTDEFGQSDRTGEDSPLRAPLGSQFLFFSPPCLCFSLSV